MADQENAAGIPGNEAFEHLPESVPDALVVGGGVSGLVLARELVRLRPEWNVVVIESGENPGGTMRSDRVRGCLCEWGPNGFLTNVPFTWDLAREVGLGERLLVASKASERRFLYVKGALREVQAKPGAFLRSDILSLRGRLRILLEPFMGRAGGGVEDSVHSFASRRIGSEAAEVLVDAMVSGIHAADPAELSLRAAFPRMAEMEERYGSLLKAMMAIRKERRRSGRPAGGGPAGPGGSLTSFDEGMEVLIRKLAQDLGPRLRLGQRVTDIEPAGEGFRVEVSGLGASDALSARRVVLATPAFATESILSAHYPRIAQILGAIPYAGITVACLLYERDQIAHPLDGFGFLVPRGQGPRMLGCIWVGSVFPPHITEKHVVMRVLLGGARDPEAAMLAEGRTIDLAHQELDRLLGGIRGNPVQAVLYRHAKGIPQYILGHPGRIASIEAELARAPGLHVLGNAYRGIGVNDCVREARALAGRMAGKGSSPDRAEAEVVAAGEGV